MVAITKRKVDDGLYQVMVDDVAVGMYVDRSVAPRYGCPQEWDVITNTSKRDHILLTAKSLKGALESLEVIANVLGEARR